MSTQSGKRVAHIKITLNKRSVEALKPADKPFIAWDDRLTGFGVRVQPSGVRSYLVNYRTDSGGRRAANRRLVIGRHGRVTAEQARRIAHETLGKVAAGEDPAEGRTRSRSTPTLREAFEEFIAVGPERKASTLETYRRTVYMDLAGWLDRSLNTISRRDVEQCFNRLTAEIGWVGANSALTMLGALYRRQCVDVEGLHNPVAQWRAAGGRLHPQRRRRIAPPAEVLPRWHRGIEKGVRSPVARDALRCGLYTGMRFSEVIELRWDRVDPDAMTLTVEETKTGEPLVIPVVRQLTAILERRLAERDPLPRAQPRLGVSVGDEYIGPDHDPAATERADRRGRRRQVLVPRASQLLHHGGGPRVDAADQPDQAAGQPCQTSGRDRGIRVGLDDAAAPRRRAAHRGSDRSADRDRDRPTG